MRNTYIHMQYILDILPSHRGSSDALGGNLRFLGSWRAALAAQSRQQPGLASRRCGAWLRSPTGNLSPGRERPRHPHKRSRDARVHRNGTASRPPAERARDGRGSPPTRKQPERAEAEAGLGRQRNPRVAGTAAGEPTGRPTGGRGTLRTSPVGVPPPASPGAASTGHGQPEPRPPPRSLASLGKSRGGGHPPAAQSRGSSGSSRARTPPPPTSRERPAAAGAAPRASPSVPTETAPAPAGRPPPVTPGNAGRMPGAETVPPPREGAPAAPRSPPPAAPGLRARRRRSASPPPGTGGVAGP